MQHVDTWRQCHLITLLRNLISLMPLRAYIDMTCSALSMIDYLSFMLIVFPLSSSLFHGPFTVLSQEGPQQGDPLGPLLFANAIQPMLCSLQSELNLGYLDDVSLGGPVDSVASDVAKIARIGGDMGLQLNTSKCELIGDKDLVLSNQWLQSFTRVDINEAILLGAPLFHGPALDKAWADRCGDLARAVDRLASISSQDALILLRSSFSAPKVMYLMRASPSVSHPCLQTFDASLRSAI